MNWGCRTGVKCGLISLWRLRRHRHRNRLLRRRGFNAAACPAGQGPFHRQPDGFDHSALRAGPREELDGPALRVGLGQRVAQPLSRHDRAIPINAVVPVYDDRIGVGRRGAEPMRCRRAARRLGRAARGEDEDARRYAKERMRHVKAMPAFLPSRQPCFDGGTFWPNWGSGQGKGAPIGTGAP